MARIFKYECDFCKIQIEHKSNATKPPYWSQLELHTRPSELNDNTGDLKRGFLICDKCTEKLAGVIARWK